jgi:hypothetical protein
MRTSLITLVLALACVGCPDRKTTQKQFYKRYEDLAESYMTGDIRTAEQALVKTERLVTNEGRAFFTSDGLALEVAFLRARRAQIAERLGDHARAQQLLEEALAWGHLAGKNTDTGGTGLLQAVSWLDEKKTINWKQSTK